MKQHALAMLCGFLLVAMIGGLAVLDEVRERLSMPLPSSPEGTPAGTAANDETRTAQPAAPQASPTSRVYRWVDDQGLVHFGDRPPGMATEVPAGALQPTVVAATRAEPATPTQPGPSVQRGATHPQPTSARISCGEIERRIRGIDARMREGYRAAEGERLRERRRQMVRLRHEHC